jgi:hypothetical protein
MAKLCDKYDMVPTTPPFYQGLARESAKVLNIRWAFGWTWISWCWGIEDKLHAMMYGREVIEGTLRRVAMTRYMALLTKP